MTRRTQATELLADLLAGESPDDVNADVVSIWHRLEAMHDQVKSHQIPVAASCEADSSPQGSMREDLRRSLL